MTAGTLLAAGVWPGAVAARAGLGRREVSSFEFLVVNDLHHMSPECTIWLRRVAAQLGRHDSARFVLLLGDLSDTGAMTSFQAVREIFGTLSVPVRFQIGNHDYASPTDRSAYLKVFPNQLNYWFRYKGWQFVGLDTTEGQKYEKTLIQPDTFSWVHRNLRHLRHERPLVLFTHFPLGEGVQYRPENADALLDLFRDYNLRAVFSGHFHSLTERSNRGGIPFTTNRCCSLKRGNHDGTKEKGYFLCRAGADGGVSHEFVEVKPG